jgi:hypothetical protein
VVFCSKGDNVTPPQQALDWILDLYHDVDEIRSYGQTIVYTVHESIGHLGIFVSGGVAKKQHSEFSSNIDLIDTLPAGLYEAVFEAKTADTANPDLASGSWVMRCVERTLDDIRALGGNDAADERRFATAARVSEVNLALYRTFAQPFVRAAVGAPLAEWMHKMHPQRLQYELFSNANPMMAQVGSLAQQVRANRRPVADDNPLVAMQEVASRQIVAALDGWRQLVESMAERTFLTVYGAPTLQAALGIEPAGTEPPRRAAKSPLHAELLQKRIAELKAAIPTGGLRAAVIRGLLYAGMARETIDERGFAALARIREAHTDLSLAAFKALVREQFNVLHVDQDAALAAIPSMLPADAEIRAKAFDLIREVLSASGPLSAEDAAGLAKIGPLFGVGDGGVATPFRQVREERQVKAS